MTATQQRDRWGAAYDWLAEHLDAAALVEFVRLYGGRAMRVPSKVRESRKQRSARVIAALGTGSTYREASEEIGVSRRTAIRDGKQSH